MPEWRRRLKERWGVDLTRDVGSRLELDARELVTKAKRFEAALTEVSDSWEDLPSGVRDALGTLIIEFGPERPVPQGDQR